MVYEHLEEKKEWNRRTYVCMNTYVRTQSLIHKKSKPSCRRRIRRENISARMSHLICSKFTKLSWKLDKTADKIKYTEASIQCMHEINTRGCQEGIKEGNISSICTLRCIGSHIFRYMSDIRYLKIDISTVRYFTISKVPIYRHSDISIYWNIDRPIFRYPTLIMQGVKGCSGEAPIYRKFRYIDSSPMFRYPTHMVQFVGGCSGEAHGGVPQIAYALK